MNKAMGAVDQVTQRNASAAEELSATSQEMAVRFASLQDLVGFFHVGGSSSQGLAPPRPAPAAAEEGIEPPGRPDASGPLGQRAVALPPHPAH